MGQRHQLFIIAKVNNSEGRKQYTCVAAFHHQWLYGQGPARATQRFLNALKNPVNSKLVLADLEAFDNYKVNQEDSYGRFITIPCPYISYLFNTVVCVAPDDCYEGRMSIESADMRSCDGDNNDGITIIDVTDPSCPRYCMVYLWDERGEDNNFLPGLLPLSARRYVTFYYPEQNDGIASAYMPLESVPLIDSETLVEAFPGEGYDRQVNKQHVVNTSDVPNDTVTQKQRDTIPLSNNMPSLTVMALKTILDSVVDAESDNVRIDTILEPILTPDMAHAIQEYLTSLTTLPDHIIPLLSHCLFKKGASLEYLDLGQYPLTAHQISLIIRDFESCKLLNLSGNKQILASDIVSLTQVAHGVEFVVLFDNKQIKYEEINRSCGCIVLHKEQFRDFVIKPQKWPNSLDSQVFIINILELKHPNTIFQGLRDFLRVIQFYGELEGALQHCFAVDQREYEVLFASSIFYGPYPHPSKIREQKEALNGGWMFAIERHDPFGILRWGFIRRQPFMSVEVLGIDDFIQTWAEERPDLPLVNADAGGNRSGPFSSFLEELQYLLGWNTAGEDITMIDEPKFPPRNCCVLYSKEQADNILVQLKDS